VSHTVAIYRNQLFRSSEPFIELQTRYLKSFDPVFVGRERCGRPVEKQRSVVVDRGWFGKLSHAIRGHSEELNHKVARYKPTLVHAHFGVDALCGANLARSLNVPLVGTLHGFDVTVRRTDLMKTGSPSLIRYGLKHRSLGETAARLLCVSNFIRERAIEFGYPEENLVTHYIGIDLNQFEMTQRVSHRTFRILHIARLVEKKGTRYLLEALHMLAERSRETVRLDVVGGGRWKPSSRSWRNSTELRTS